MFEGHEICLALIILGLAGKRAQALTNGGCLNRRFLFGLIAAIGGLVAAAVAVGYLRWTARDTTAVLAEARQLRASGDLASAARAYDRYLHLAGKAADSDAVVDRALIALEVASEADATPTQVYSAINAANAAIRRRSTDARLRRSLAELQLANGNYREAREHLLAVRDSLAQATAEGDPAEIELLLARTWFGTGDHRQAMTIVADLTGFSTESRSFTSGDPAPFAPLQAYLLLADILRDRIGDADAAARVVERCAKAHPDDPAALVPFVWLMLSRDEPRSALEAASRAAALAPSDASALVAYAQALSATGDVAAAAAAFTEAVRRCPSDSFALTAALREFPQGGTTEQILTLVGAAFDQLPKNESDVLAFLASMTLDYAAWREFARVLDGASERLRADHPAVIVLQARLLAARGHWSAAERPLQKARALVPKHSKATIDVLLGQCLAKLGDHDEAIEVYHRLKQGQFLWWKSSLGAAEVWLALGQPSAAAEEVRKVEIASRKAVTSENVARYFDSIVPTLTPIIRVTAAQPVEERDWSFVDHQLELLQATPQAPASAALAAVKAEMLAARGDVEGALAMLPDPSSDALASLFDPLRLSLIARSDGVEPMRTALAALPDSRRDRGQVLEAVALAESRRARGDEREWLRSIASAGDRIIDDSEAVQLLHFLADLATKAAWMDEARGLWSRATQRLPTDFRAPLALALEAARTGDATAAAQALEQIDAIEDQDSARRRLAAAAALVAAVRTARSDESAPLTSAQLEQLEEARALLRGTSEARKRWQAVASLSSEIESIAGNQAAAVAQLEQAVAWGPRAPELIREFATSLDRNRRHAEALSVRDSITPASFLGGDRLAIDTLLAERDYSAAADRAISSVDLAKADSATLIWLGRLCSRAGMQAESSRFFNQATRVDPSEPDAWIRLAEFLASEGEEDAAVAAIGAGLDSVSENDRLLLSARGAAVLGRTAEAEDALRDGVRQARGDTRFAAYLVDHLVERGRVDQAIVFLKEVVDLKWGDRRDFLLWAKSRLAGLRAGASP